MVGPSFLGFSGYHKKPQKRGKHFLQGPPRCTPLPPPQPLDDSTKLCATFGDRVFISATGKKHKIQRWRDGGPWPSRMFLYFPTSRFVAIILHDLRGNNLIQQSFVTFFVSFLTDVSIGSCFLPQQFSAARMNVPARIIVTRAVHYSVLFNPKVVQRLYLYDIFFPSSIKLF